MNPIQSYAEDLAAIRHDLHMHPELLFEEFRTSAIVAKELARLGFKVTTGLAGTGVIGTLANGTGRRSIGLRADMDALPIEEMTGLPYASQTRGKMHACGHDGHTTMLLGAARYLSETKKFDGTVHLIFQPAEEDVSGAKKMVEEGLFKRFPCDAIFAMHNMPGYPEGQMLVRPGAIMAAVDTATAVIRGVGGHGAMPHRSIDPIVAASSIVMALQTIVSRNVDPGEAAVITVGAFNAGISATIIPEKVTLEIGIRTCSKEVRADLSRRIPALIKMHAESLGCTADVDYRYSYPVTVNSEKETAIARSVGVATSGNLPIVDLPFPLMVSEDFAYMLDEVPGCYLLFGNGNDAKQKMLHDPGYDFNDGLLVKGANYWGKLVEHYLSPS